MAVTPVRTGPLPISSLPSPEMSVVWPTSTPLTSVRALLGPGVPSNGTPRSRARGLLWAKRIAVYNGTISTNPIRRKYERDMEPPAKEAVYRAVSAARVAVFGALKRAGCCGTIAASAIFLGENGDG